MVLNRSLDTRAYLVTDDAIDPALFYICLRLLDAPAATIYTEKTEKRRLRPLQAAAQMPRLDSPGRGGRTNGPMRLPE